METINIAVNCSDMFFFGLRKTLKTLFDSNKGVVFAIYSLGTINEKNVKKITKYVERHGHSFHKVEVDDNLFSNNVDKSLYFYVGLRRLLIPYLLTNCDRVLYLDCDLVINKSVAPLFSANLGKCLIGCAPDLGFDKEYISSFEAKYDIKNYFNSGVILFDCKAIRTLNNYQSLLSLISGGNKYRYLDQDILNILYGGKIKDITLNNNFQITPNEHFKSVNILKTATIVHYLGTKPWQYGYPLFSTQSRFFWKKVGKFPFLHILFFKTKNRIVSVRIHLSNLFKTNT